MMAQGEGRGVACLQVEFVRSARAAGGSYNGDSNRSRHEFQAGRVPSTLSTSELTRGWRPQPIILSRQAQSSKDSHAAGHAPPMHPFLGVTENGSSPSNAAVLLKADHV